MKVMIVESPTKVRKISKFLPPDFKVVATGGHVRDLPEDSMGISLEELKNGIVKPTWQVIKGKWKFVKNIREAVKRASEVYVATDPDREGEAIGWHISQLLGIPDPKRIVFHEITKKAVLSALANPGKIDMKLVRAQLCRRILDRIVGYTLSPVFWRIRKNSSAGRVQSATLYLIVKRWEEHKNFTPTPYWIIKFKTDDFTATLWERDGKREKVKIFERWEDVENVKSKIVELEVDEVRQKVVSITPPPPYNTSSLLQDAKKILGWSSEKTMRIAQELFENGLITYHRTDSLTLSDEAISMAQRWLSRNMPHLSGSPRNFKTKVANAQEAHEAIRPTEEGLRKVESFVRSGAMPRLPHMALLKLITTRFLASQAKPKIQKLIETRFKVKDLPPNLFAVAKAKKTLFKGFEEIFKPEEEEDEDKDLSPFEKLEKLTQGTVIRSFKTIPEKRMTQPPPLYTEATLIKTMEKLGIGRPSTYAPTIATLKKRGYIKEEKGKLIPTESGIFQTKLLEKNFREICLPDFTAHMEEALDMISRGEIDWKKWLADFTREYEKKLEEFKSKLAQEKELVSQLAKSQTQTANSKPQNKYKKFWKYQR